MSKHSSSSPETAAEHSDSAASDADHESDRRETQSQLSKDVIFSLLSVERRRHVLQYLAEHEGETTLSELSEHIAATENDTEISRLSSQQRKRVYVGLYQCHLPKLDDADVIDYNQSRGTVKRRPNADLLYPYLAIDPPVSIEDDSEESGEETTIREKLETYLPRQRKR